MLYPVIQNVDLGEGWRHLEVDAPELAPRCRAGQFVQVRVGEGDDPLVRRPFSVYDVGPAPGAQARRLSVLYQVVGPGTRWMARLSPGDPVDLLGPLGNPFPQFDLPPDGRLILIGGGIGVAPLFFYCRELLAERRGLDVHVLIGARRRSLLVSEPRFREHGFPLAVATNDGSSGHHGTVIELLEAVTRGLEPRQVAGVGCGPHAMNMALREFAVRRDFDLWIALDNYMPCGFGACFGCVIPSPGGGYRRVCVDGPAFPAREIPTAG
ncbi:MAG: dihydroorotate dehydrogenase electron transfer subunit [Planctomycetota bacterium]